MPVHPQVQAVLDQGMLLPPMETLSVTAARQRTIDAFCSSDPPLKVDLVQDECLDLTLELNRKSIRTLFDELPPTQVRVRFYIPKGPKPCPALIFFHGGGFVLNTLDTHDAVCRNLASQGDCMVISVDYARAPEFPYPAAVQQSFAVISWLWQHADRFNINPDKIAVGGDSSGGTLAAGVCLMARDLKGPDICFQLLIYPALDHCSSGTGSYKKFAQGYSLTQAIMKWFYHLYIPENINLDAPYLFPARAPDLHGLPPAHIITAEYDPLRDEGEHYAHRLHKAGNRVTQKRYPGMIHGFIVMHRAIDMGKQALTDVGEILKKQFSGKNICSAGPVS